MHLGLYAVIHMQAISVAGLGASENQGSLFGVPVMIVLCAGVPQLCKLPLAALLPRDSF